MIDDLLPFGAIGWDFDGTLIDHPAAPVMHAFILDHPEKRHFILTFRSHGLQKSMFRELRLGYPHAPGPDAFAGVRNIPDKAWSEFIGLEQLRLLNQITGPLRPWEEYFMEWKGMVCDQLHVPVLIDDKEAHVLRGCEKYGIRYMHPDDFYDDL